MSSLGSSRYGDAPSCGADIRIRSSAMHHAVEIVEAAGRAELLWEDGEPSPGGGWSSARQIVSRKLP